MYNLIQTEKTSSNPKKKITISPSLGLLVLASHYKNKIPMVDLLKKRYFSGATNAEQAKEIKEFLDDEILSNYNISYEKNIINNDPTRRYFETHLAYHTIKNGLKEIDHDELNTYLNLLINLLPSNIFDNIQHILNGNIKAEDTNLNKEYADYILKLSAESTNQNTKVIFTELSQDEREKIKLLAKISFLAVIVSKDNFGITLPLKIYGTGMFTEENRGRKLLSEQKTTRNWNFGLMKGHMPTACNDLAREFDEPTDVAKQSSFTKPSELTTFVEGASWVENNFIRLVHPFSNSISGTFLCQLRALAKLRNDGHIGFCKTAEKMALFSKLLISAMIFKSGGHSFFEFTSPMFLPEVQQEFENIPNFDKLDLESIYYTNNKEAFDSAFGETISYATMILFHKNIQVSITENLAHEYPSYDPILSPQINRSQNFFQKYKLKHPDNSLMMNNNKKETNEITNHAEQTKPILKALKQIQKFNKDETALEKNYMQI